MRTLGLFPWSLIRSHLGVMWANDTQSVFSMSSRLLNSGLVAVTAENLASHRCDGGNGNNCVSMSSSSSSPIENGFLGLATRLASKCDALRALAVVDVEALTNYFCSCSCFFPSKYSEGLFLMQSAWSVSGEAVLKASLPHRRAGRHICRVGFGGWESPVTINLYLKSKALLLSPHFSPWQRIFPKMSLF